MSRQRSRSPLHSRYLGLISLSSLTLHCSVILWVFLVGWSCYWQLRSYRTSTLLGRREGYYTEQYHAPVHSDLWGGSENVGNRNADGAERWNNGSSQTEEQVDHWAKFIEAIGRAGKRKASSMSRYHEQDSVQSFDENSARSPRQLSQERLSSQEASHYGVEMHQRIQSPGLRRNEHDAAHVDRRYSRSSSPRHSQGKRYDRMEHGYLNEEHEDRYDRSSYSERYKNTDLLKRRRGVEKTWIQLWSH